MRTGGRRRGVESGAVVPGALDPGEIGRPTGTDDARGEPTGFGNGRVVMVAYEVTGEVRRKRRIARREAGQREGER